MADITLEKQLYDKEYRKKNKAKIQHKNAGYYTGVRKKAFIADPAKYLWGVAKVRAKQKGIDFRHYASEVLLKEVITMLRQQQERLVKAQGLVREYTALSMRQQAEIEALKVKELTDEEIDYEFDEFCWVGNRRVDFELILRQVERAILRKAQEK